MPTTSWGLRYPASSAAPNVNQDIQNLASDVETTVIPRFTTVAARNAAITSPVANRAAIVAGRLHIYDGSAWRFSLDGVVAGTTDANGIITFAHGGGQTPTAVVITPKDAGDTANQLVKWVWQSADATIIQARAVRTDTSVYWVGVALSFAWMARF